MKAYITFNLEAIDNAVIQYPVEDRPSVFYGLSLSLIRLAVLISDIHEVYIIVIIINITWNLKYRPRLFIK